MTKLASRILLWGMQGHTYKAAMSISVAEWDSWCGIMGGQGRGRRLGLLASSSEVKTLVDLR